MDYPTRLSFLNLPSLERKRLTADLILTNKIIFGLLDIKMEDYFQLQYTNDDHTITRGNPYKLFVNYCRTNVRKNLFSERVVKVWNSLPPTVVNFSTLSSFRNSLHDITFIYEILVDHNCVVWFYIHLSLIHISEPTRPY